MNALQVMYQMREDPKNQELGRIRQDSQRVLVDGIEVLSGAFEGLFSRVYNQTAIPTQWQI